METIRNISHLFTHTTTLRRNVPTSDGHGGYKEALTTVETLQGRLWPATERDMQLAGQNEARVTHAWVAPPYTDVRVDDVLVINGRTFQVRVPHLEPSVNIYRKCLVEEVQRA
jgi:hypothetical protein